MPSTECASCFQQRTQTRSRNPPTSPNGLRSVQRMQAWLPSSWDPKPPRAASSAPHSPAAADERPNTHHGAGPTPPQLATAPPAVSFDEAACCETHPTAVAAARSHQEWALRFYCSISDDLGD